MTLHQLTADPAAVLVAGAVLALAITVAVCTLAVLGALRALAMEHECDRADASSDAEVIEGAVMRLVDVAEHAHGTPPSWLPPRPEPAGETDLAAWLNRDDPSAR